MAAGTRRPTPHLPPLLLNRGLPPNVTGRYVIKFLSPVRNPGVFKLPSPVFLLGHSNTQNPLKLDDKHVAGVAPGTSVSGRLPFGGFACFGLAVRARG